MKKRLIALIPIISVIIFCGCGVNSVQKGPTNIGSTIGGNNNNNNSSYSVSLICDGELYNPPGTVKAEWSNGISSTQSSFNSDGVAYASGLDGEYSVSIDGLPEGYIYNPNDHIATNDAKDIEIEVFRERNKSGSGKTTGSAYRLVVGVSRIQFNEDTDTVFCKYTPSRAGVYSIESWVDTSVNEINPIADIYSGSEASNFWLLTETRDGGSMYYNSFTKNFRYEMVIESSVFIGNTFMFGIRYDSLSNVEYPVNIDFEIKYVGQASITDYGTKQNMTPTEDFEARRTSFLHNGIPFEPLTKGKWEYCYESTNNVLISKNYKLNPEDGLYHVYNSLTGMYGAIVYAKISADCTCLNTQSKKGFLDSMVESAIQSIIYQNGSGYVNRNYLDFIATYGKNCNSDGTYPVTEELKQFLQDYCKSQLLFMDGEGIAESWYHLKSGEPDQWLFACGIYK